MKRGLLFCLLQAFHGIGWASVHVDDSIPDYKSTRLGAASIQSVGSDTLNNLMYLWSEAFNKLYPSIQIRTESKGSSTAEPALTKGVSQLAPTSRKLKTQEIQNFEKKYGYEPTKITVAVQMMVIIVHKSNPIQQLSFSSLDAMFSSTRFSGHPTDILRWGQLDLKGEWEHQPINMYSLNSASASYGYIKKKLLSRGDFKASVRMQPSGGPVLPVSRDRYGIGYTGYGYLTSGVKVLALKAPDSKSYIKPTYENAVSGKYPLARNLYIYINQHPQKPMRPALREFLKFVLSKQGQEAVIKDGYLPLKGATVKAQLAKLQ